MFNTEFTIFFYDAVPYVIPVGDSRKINYKMNKNGERYDENRDSRTGLSHRYMTYRISHVSNLDLKVPENGPWIPN